MGGKGQAATLEKFSPVYVVGAALLHPVVDAAWLPQTGQTAGVPSGQAKRIVTRCPSRSSSTAVTRHGVGSCNSRR